MPRGRLRPNHEVRSRGPKMIIGTGLHCFLRFSRSKVSIKKALGMISSWKADHLRLSLFSDKSWETAPEVIYLAIFGEQPESVGQKPMLGEATAEGIWKSKQVSVRKQINRLDIVMQPAVTATPEMPALLSSIDTLLPTLATATAKWCSANEQDIFRIAVGCGGMLEVHDRNENYRTLYELVKAIKIDVDRFKDFNFQVNLPVTSLSVEGLTINRLSNWSALEMHTGIFGAGSTNIAATSHFCRCISDVNTDGERTSSLPKDKIQTLIDEMSNLSIKILQEGIE